MEHRDNISYAFTVIVVLAIMLVVDLSIGLLLLQNPRMIELPLLLITLVYALDIAFLYSTGIRRGVCTVVSMALTLYMLLTITPRVPSLECYLLLTSLVLKSCSLSLLTIGRFTSSIASLRLTLKVGRKRIGLLVLKIARVVEYLSETPQFFFIVPFMILLVVAALFLSWGNEQYANSLAVYAYYQLVLGVIAAIATTITRQLPALPASTKPRVPKAEKESYIIPYLPTPYPIIDRIVDLANPRAGEVFCDFGSGDGRILVAMASRGCYSIGIEIDRKLVKKSLKNARKLHQNIDIILGDMFYNPLRRVDIVYTFLDEKAMRLLRRDLEEMIERGTRLVSLTYRIPERKPTLVLNAYDESVLEPIRTLVGDLIEKLREYKIYIYM